MRLWFVAAGLVASGTLGLIVRRLWRRHHDRPDIAPVTNEWLAEAASREDHAW
jgi:hypothetical protein